METFFWNALTIISSLVAVVIKGLMIGGSKFHQKNLPVVCDGCVKYEEEEEEEVDRLVAILKTNKCGGGSGGERTVWNTVSSPPRRGLLNYINQDIMEAVGTHTHIHGLLSTFLSPTYKEWGRVVLWGYFTTGNNIS